MNVYVYVHNNPVNGVDPLGLSGVGDAIVGWLEDRHSGSWGNNWLGRFAGDANAVSIALLQTSVRIADGVIESPRILKDQVFDFSVDPALNSIPVLGPIGVSIGDSAFEFSEDPNVDTGIQLAGSVGEGALVALGPSVAARRVKANNKTRATSPEGVAPNTIDNGLSSRGVRPAPGTRVRPEGVPENWRIRGTDTPGGTEYYNPSNPNESIRVMQGNPNSPYPNSQAPYARQRNAGGTYYRADGSLSPEPRGGLRDPDAHIPLDQFEVR